MACKVEYTKAAREQLKKLPRDVSLRITKYMDERAAVMPREHGKAMTGDYSGFWRYRVGHRSDVYKR